MSSLLVIGGSGFFGKSILDAFSRNRLSRYGIQKLICLSRNVDDISKNHPDLMADGVELVRSDISSCKEIPKADFVIHAASSTNAQNYILNSSKEKANIEASVTNFCEIVSQNHRDSKIVYCSSGAVYGKQLENQPYLHEEDILTDVSALSYEKQAYALGKRFAEERFRLLGLEGFNVSIARCFAFYGKYLPKDQHFAYGNFIGEAEKGGNIQVNAKNTVIRSYMSADLMVDSLMVVLKDASPSCEVYNVGSDLPISIHDLAKRISEKYHVSFQIADQIDHKNVDRYVPNSNKLKSLLIKEFGTLPAFDIL